MHSNFLYPTLFVSITLMCVAACLIASRARNHYSPEAELMAQMPVAEDASDEATDIDERNYTYSVNQNEWSDSGSFGEASPVPETSEAQSTPERRRCPRCGSDRIEKRNQARKAGSTIGAVAGATSGVAMTLCGAEVGATVGLIAGPVGSVFGGLAGAIVAGIAASAAGCAAGAAMGEVIDENVLDNHRCSACGHTFNASA